MRVALVCMCVLPIAGWWVGGAVPPVQSVQPVIGILSTPPEGADIPCDTISAAMQSKYAVYKAMHASGFGLSQGAAHGIREGAASFRGSVSSAAQSAHAHSTTDGMTQQGSAPGCFATLYAKWLESGGARVVVIPYNANSTVLDSLLTRLNGVLFTGGGLNISTDSQYVQTARYIFNKVQAMNAAGTYLPLHGTCMGMQLLSVLSAGQPAVLTTNKFDSENISYPLFFTPDALKVSRMFSSFPDAINTAFGSMNITENLHHDGVEPQTFAQNSELRTFWNLISTNVDRKGLAFISTLEAKALPITATQWHPERPQFEHTPGLGINSSLISISAMQYVANFFVNEARRNNQSFVDRPDLFAAFTTYALNGIPVGDISWGYQAYYLTYP